MQGDIPVGGEAGLGFLDIGDVEPPEIDVEYLGEASLEQLQHTSKTSMRKGRSLVSNAPVSHVNLFRGS